MTKRPYDDSGGPLALNLSPGGDFNNAVSSMAVPRYNEQYSAAAPTAFDQGEHNVMDLHQDFNVSNRSRNFIAVVACETCRVKKTRCDEEKPQCGQCKTLGVACSYLERPPRKKDQSIEIIISAVRRMESKLESIPSKITSTLLQSGRSLSDMGSWSNPKASISRSGGRDPLFGVQETTITPRTPLHDEFISVNRSNLSDSSGWTNISYSQHGVLFWPAIFESSSPSLLRILDNLEPDYTVNIEQGRAPLPMTVASEYEEDWLKQIPRAVVKALVDAFFTTFNPMTPVMEKAYFVSVTLKSVIQNSFDYSIDACLTLIIMALGCLAVRSYEEGGYDLKDDLLLYTDISLDSPEWIGMTSEEVPGLRFFNLSRKRLGFLVCDNGLLNCQYYLLSGYGLYYNQIIRPVDSWAMINRACVCCLTMLRTRQKIRWEEWEGDMKSRAFWICLMLESVIVQELNLPPSGIASMEDRVPLPKFVHFVNSNRATGMAPLSDEEHSCFQYHFLAQVAHRLLLSRIKDSLFFYSKTQNFPPAPIVAELRHQLEQWRNNLPEAIRSDIESSDARPSTPANGMLTTMLRGRYRIAKFHIGRPFLYKALHRPADMTEDDLRECHEGLSNAMDWPQVKGVCELMKSCMPLKPGLCSLFFGQLILFNAIRGSPESRVRQTLPDGWERWCAEMMNFLEEHKTQSPAVAKDVEILKMLSWT